MVDHKMNVVSRFFDIKEGEGKPLLILFIHHFFLTAMCITGISARDALFLNLFEKTYFPLMFVAIALAMAGVIPLYTKLTKGRDHTFVIVTSSLIFACTLIPLSLALYGFVIPLIFIWMEIIIILSITQFWILAGQVFNPRQAKRLFGLIIISGSIASIIVGSGMRTFVQLFGSDKLLLATAFFLGITTLTSFLIRPHRSQLSGCFPRPVPTKEKGKAKFDRYLIAITVVICSMAFVSRFVDYQFKITASNAFPSQDELVNFFGTFYAITGAAIFIVQLFFTGRILARFGVLVGLIILPMGLFVGSIGFLVMPILATIFLAKFSDNVFKFTINNSTLQLLWLPVNPQTKNEKRPVIDGMIKSLIEGFAGISIFISAKWIPLHYLSIAVLGVAGVWIYYTFDTKRGYIKALQKAIEKRFLNFEDTQIDVADSAMVETIEKTLIDDDETKQVIALELIEGIPLKPWSKTLNKLFHGKSIEVSKAVLKMAAEDSNIISDQELLDILKNKDLALEAISVVGRRKLKAAIPIVESYLLDPDPELQVMAAASLQFLGSKKMEEARSLIKGKIKSKNPKIQAIAIKHLTDQEEILTDKLLKDLMGEASEITRNAALGVALKRNNNDLIPSIVSNLSDPKTLPTARNILLQYPKDVVIEEFLKKLKDPNINEGMLRGIVIIVRVLHTGKMIEALIDLIKLRKKGIIIEVIDTLLILGRKKVLSEDQTNKVKAEVYQASKHAYMLVNFLHSIEEIDKEHLLNEVIKHELSRQIPYLLKLGIIDMPGIPVESYLQIIKEQDPRQMPFVMEVLDNIFDIDKRELIIPLVEGVKTKTLVKVGRKNFNDIPINIKKHLSTLIANNKGWATTVAIDFALKHQLISVLNDVSWEQIEPTRITKEVINNYEIKDTLREKLANFKLSKEELSMYSTLEKTILLKTVSLFQTIPTKDLSKVAQVAEEERFNAGALLFSEGDYGDSLYIVVDGEVKVHKGDRHISSLGKGACLGEMALLDQEPRSADVTMETEATLLKITQEDFYEIMSSNIEVMQGVLRLLTGRLREAIN